MAGEIEIQAPVAKAATALGAGAGASAASVMRQAESFFPVDFGGWAAAIASCIAVGYTASLWGEWWWKKVLRPFLADRGWLK